MGKRSKRSRNNKSSSSSSSFSNRRPAPALRGSRGGEEEIETHENLKFEDPFVDEVEEDEDVIINNNKSDADSDDDDDEEMMGEDDDDEEDDMQQIQSWNPFTGYDELNEGETLEMDPSAYKMYHALHPANWPSLSFAFVRDELGETRTRFPHTLTAIVGTQAPSSSGDGNKHANGNQLTVMKLSDLSRIHIETEDDILGEEYKPNNKSNNKDDDSDEDDDSDDEEDDDLDIDPIVESFSIPHYGGVNRIRAMPQQSHVVATWSDVGNVNLYNVESIVSKFSEPSATAAPAPAPSSSSSSSQELKPFFVHSGHTTEGYALDWSSVKQGYMASGDNDGNIHLWTPRPEGGYEVVPSYESKQYTSGSTGNAISSIEDIQWSPTEATVFCTAECGGYVRIFDTRAPHRAMLSHKISQSTKGSGNGATAADVNVVSWNHLVTNLLACGDDDGVLSVWDLRHFSSSAAASSSSNGGGGGNNTSPDPLARFTTHKTPITSVEWHPTDESMLAASDDVGTYIYDLSVEEDDAHAHHTAAAGVEDVPPQLLFVHCGSEQFKEVHWHPQIQSCLMTTALSGFSVFIPSNL